MPLVSRFAFFFALLIAAAGCGGSDANATLLPIPAQTTRVNSTLRVPIVVQGTGNLSFAYEGPADLPALDSTVSISGNTAGGELRWTPLASHVGTWEFQIILRHDGAEIHRTPVVIDVEPAADAAPVFLRPAAGGTYDLAADPCVTFAIEVRDDDSDSVELRAEGELPAGAELTQRGPKQGEFEWCPTADQVAAAERWFIDLVADDGRFETPKRFVVVLRTENKPGCPGEPPMVTIASPGESARVTAEGGYEVVAMVSDDQGLRDAPLLFYTTSEPDDASAPDITAFEQVVMRPSSGNWAGRIPDLGLLMGQEQQLYVLVSATDNDDASGTGCDHRTDSALRTFVAVGGDGGSFGGCEPCTENADCGSGICGVAAGGNQCLPACSDSPCAVGTCGSTVTADGAVLAACGPVSAVCGGGMCEDDSAEDDDTIETAQNYMSSIDGQVCSGDSDYIRIGTSAGDRVIVNLGGYNSALGDLDLQLLDASGTILDSSASGSDGEQVMGCAMGSALYARVFGYDSAENEYLLTVAQEAGGCNSCTDDSGEQDDTRETARALTLSGGSADFEGTICPNDDDWMRFEVTEPSRLEATLVIDDSEADLDLWVYGPAGEVVASARTFSDEESISELLTNPGSYTLRVDGIAGDTSDYIGELTLMPASTCASSQECPIDQVCSSGGCIARGCTEASPMCPADHACPNFGTTSAWECGASCAVNRDCRPGEACKWTGSGRYCLRRGSGANGDACSSAADCGGQRGCIAWAGGTCGRQGCMGNSDCESGTQCIPTGLGYNACALSCADTAFRCRIDDGYTCEDVIDAEGTSRPVCVPPGFGG